MAEYTEDLCEGGVATSNGYWSDWTPEKAFDNDPTTGWHKVGFPSLLQYQLPEPKKISKYTITPRDGLSYQAPGNFTFEGSNDGNDWVVLDTRPDEVEADWPSGVKREFFIENENSYLYYRLNVISAVTTSNCSVMELEMMEKLITEINPNRPDLVNKLYNTKKTRLRGKAKEGFVRPTISQFFTSRLPRWSPVPSSTSPAIGEFIEGGYYFGTIEVSGTTYYLVAADKVSGETQEEWSPAVSWCNSRTIGGYSDWYLPAKDELDLLYDNHTALESAGAGIFATAYYWSSTEHTTSGSAWRQYFGSGVQDTTNETYTGYVRAIRRFAA